MNEVGVEYAAETKNMSGLMNANFDVHLEGQGIEGEVVDVPVQDSPHWFVSCLRVGAGVGISCYSCISVVLSFDEDAKISIGDGISDDLLRNCEGKTLYECRIDSTCNIKT